MKTTLLTALLFSTTLSASVSIPDYNWQVTDLAEAGLKKEELFSRMDRKFIKVGSSICANRALMWLNDFKTSNNVDGAKIFLFYTNKSHGIGLKTWWYHVAPIVAENNELFVMDAGFNFPGPVTPKTWMDNFSRGGNCKEIKAGEDDLIELMHQGQQFPTNTRYGEYNCYYKIVPAGLWFPQTVAASLTGGNIPNEIQNDEVYAACLEAVTSPIGRRFGAGKKSCRKYIGQ